MIKFLARVSSAILAALVLSCCATITTPRPESPDDCLVIIKSSFIGDAGVNPEATQSLVYKYRFSGDYPEVFVRRDFSLVLIREPAVEMRSVLSGISSSMYYGKRSEYPIKNLILPYKPGYVQIADYVFENKVTSDGGHGFYYSWRLRKITEEEREELLQKLGSDSAFDSWKK